MSNMHSEDKHKWTKREIDFLVEQQKEHNYEYQFHAQRIKGSDLILVNDRMMEPSIAEYFYKVINRNRQDGENHYFNNRLPVNPKSEHDRVFHKKYLTSKTWQEKRKEVLKRDGNKCTKCGKEGKGLICHHVSYENLGNEPLEDLLTFCRNCHANLHWIEAIGEKRESGGL